MRLLREALVNRRFLALAPAILLAAVLSPGSVADSAAAGQKPPTLRIETVTTLDTVPVKASHELRSPTYLYKPSLTPPGGVVVLRLPNGYAYPEGRERDQADLFDEVAGRSWQPLRLPLWDSKNAALQDPEVCVDVGGTLWLAWEGIEARALSAYAKIYGKSRGPDRAWSNAIVLTDEGAREVTSLSLSCADRRGGLIVWTDARERHADGPSHPHADAFAKVYARTFTPAETASATRVTHKEGTYISEGVRVRGNLAGDAYAVWDQGKRESPQSLYASRRQRGGWTEPRKISDDSADMHLAYDLAVLPDGTAYIFWSGPRPKEELYYRSFTGDSLGTIHTLGTGTCCVRAAASKDGQVHIVYQDSYPREDPGRFSKGHLYYQRLQEGVWSDRQEIAKEIFFDTAAVAVDAEMRLHLFWQELVNNAAEFKHALAAQEP